MSKIYLPSEFIDNCNVVNNGYIRSYTNSNRSEWVDIYVNQDYMLKHGFNQYGSNVVCDNINEYTDNFYYRTDFTDILIGFSILSYFIILLPLTIFKTLFKRGGF